MSVAAAPQLSVEVLTRSGRAADVGFCLNNRTVEVWHRGSMTAWFDRHDIGSWLDAPHDRLRGTAMEFVALDRRAGTGVAITLFEVSMFELSPTNVDALRELVRLS